MRILNVAISELEYNKFGLKKEKLTFSDFIDIVSKEVSKQALNKSLLLAEKYGLSGMTMKEITKEVKAVRKKHAKSNS